MRESIVGSVIAVALSLVVLVSTFLVPSMSFASSSGSSGTRGGSISITVLPATVESGSLSNKLFSVVRVVRPVAGGGGGGGDVIPPRISNVSASNITKTGADIYWETQELSDSQVEYWASPSMLSELDEEMVVDHHIRLTGLTTATTYHYKTMSKDGVGNLAVSDEYTFATPGTPAIFTISDLTISPTEVGIDESVTISAVVSNTGDTLGSYKVTFTIDKVVVATEDVTLAGGASQGVGFATSKDIAGTYTVNVGDLMASFVVRAVLPSLPPSPVPLPYQPPILPETPRSVIPMLAVSLILPLLVVAGVTLLVVRLVRRRRREGV